MIEPRFIPPQMPADPGIVRLQRPRRITARQSLLGLAGLAAIASVAAVAVQIAIIIGRAMA